MFRKTIVAITAVAMLGTAVLAPSTASAARFGGGHAVSGVHAFGGGHAFGGHGFGGGFGGGHGHGFGGLGLALGVLGAIGTVAACYQDQAIVTPRGVVHTTVNVC
jgi:hypothetical protein